ncbi:MAG: sigma-70 family RNA polymerase sigma factor [Planctomycetes bacterium]|nr:sigma-70 family RNA polymerase sigma factor [Planctomycetota bacterium]
MDQAPESLDPEELLAHAGWVRALAVALVGESRADDLAQATMLRAIERPPRHKSNIRAWLGTVARNFAISWSRKDIRQRELLQKRVYEDRRDRENAAESAAFPETPDQLLGKSEAASQVMQALQDLPDPGRHLLMLRYVEGLTPAQIAKRYDMKAVTVRVQLSRALEELRRLMRRRFGGDGMAPCRALLAPLPFPWVVPPTPELGWLVPLASAGGILTATLVGVYLWDASGSPPADPLLGAVAERVRPDESERDSASANLANVGGGAGASRIESTSARFALQVLDEEGAGIEGARLRLHRDGSSMGSGGTDSSGLLSREAALGSGVLQLSARDHTPELLAGEWGLGEHSWVLPERQLIAGRVRGAEEEVGRGLFLALVGDEPLYREGSPEFGLLGQIDQRYASFKRFLISVREGGEFRFAGLPAGWAGYLISQDPRFRIDDDGLDDRADGRLRVRASDTELRVRLEVVPRLSGQVEAPLGREIESLRGTVLAFALPEGVVRIELDETGCFELLCDPADLEGLTVLAHAPSGGEGHFHYLSVPLDGDLGVLQLESQPLARLQIVDGVGVPIEGANVRATAPEWLAETLPAGERLSDAAGMVEFALPRSSESVQVLAPGYTSRRVARSELRGGRGVQQIELAAANGLLLTLEGPDGPLPAGAADNLEVRMALESGLLSSDPALDRAFVPTRGSVLTSVITSRGLVAARFRPDAEACIELEGVRAGEALRVEVRSRIGELLLEQTLAPLASAGRADARLRLTRTPRIYEGVVTGPDGRSVAEAMVNLRAPGHAGVEAGTLQAVTDLQGRFRFPALWRDEVGLRVSAPGFALTLDPARALPVAGTKDSIRLEEERELTVAIRSAAGDVIMPQQLTVRDEEGRLVRAAIVEGSGRLRVHGLGASELALEVFVDGWIYRKTIGVGQSTYDFILPERVELPMSLEGWEGPDSDAELAPHLILRRNGGERSQAVFLVPHPEIEKRWVLPTRVLLPVGDWEIETPSGDRQSLIY